MYRASGVGLGWASLWQAGCVQTLTTVGYFFVIIVSSHSLGYYVFANDNILAYWGISSFDAQKWN